MASRLAVTKLTLLPEIRAQILRYILPYSLPTTENHQVTWVRGSIAPLLVNKQLSDESMDLMYGSNTFKLIITYEGILFRCSWLLPSGLRPNSTYMFPNAFSKDALRRIRHVLVLVEHVDSYKGMIKYNCGGRGLSEGVRGQIQRLVDILAMNTSGLGRVTVRLEGNAVLNAIRKRAVKAIEHYESGGVDQSVLDPFTHLTNVSSPNVGGNVNATYARKLEEKMNASSLRRDSLVI